MNSKTHQTVFSIEDIAPDFCAYFHPDTSFLTALTAQIIAKLKTSCPLPIRLDLTKFTPEF